MCKEEGKMRKRIGKEGGKVVKQRNGRQIRNRQRTRRKKETGNKRRK